MRQDVTTQREAAAPSSWLGWVRFVGFLLLLYHASGCATLTIPAFDPSGNRIFATTPTQLTLPQLHGPNGTSLVPNSSFPEPRTPLPCLQVPQPSQGQLASNRMEDRGRCGQMLLTPTRLVAPVGGEVVLLAGICGEDGLLVTGEPIEWMLSPDGVGEIIEVGDDLKGKRPPLFGKAAKPTVEKLDVDFARGRTSSEAGRITRGSSRSTDDLIIKKGQTWISLTSATQGTTRVTALAPDSDVWDRRRQTATIYWIDASWQFPGPQNPRLGEVATLVTRVMKAEGFEPATGWIVKYRLLNEGIAAFRSTNPNAPAGVDVRVDDEGKAIAQLNNVSGKPGTALVEISVVKPASASEHMDEVTLARTQVPVTWMSPLLDLRVTANDTTSVNEPVDFRIWLANPGNYAAENVKLVMNFQNPALQASYPLNSPKDQGNLGATWNIGSIAPGHFFEAIVQLVATQEADYRILFNATASPNLAQNLEKPLLAVRPEIELRFAPAPGNEQAEINQPVVLEAVATNRSRQTINNLSLFIDSDPGLQHAETGGNRISQTIPYLPAGQSQTLGFRFIVQKPGDLKASLKAQIQNVVVAERSAMVRGIAPVPRQPAMAVQLVPQGPNMTLQPNAEVGVSGFVKNPGQTRLTNIQAVVQYAPSLALTKASSGIDHQIQNRVAQWFIPVLESGQQIEVKLVFQSIAPTPPPILQMSARSSEGLSDQTSLTFNVGNDGGTDRPVLPFTPPDANVLPPVSSGPSPSTNDPLSFQLLPIEQTVGTGQRSRFEIRFQNSSPVQDQNAEVMLRLPPGVQVTDVRYRDGTLIRPTFQDNNLMRIPPILTIRPNEAISMIVELQHAVPGSLPLEAFLRTAAFPQGFTRQATINVRPN